MDFDVQNRTLEERVSKLNWRDLILDNIPDCVVMLYCLASFFAINKFRQVLGGPRRLQKLNMMLIVFTALAIVARNITLKLGYVVLPQYVTYGINWMLGLILITDVIVLLANALNVVMLVVHKSEKPLDFWKMSMCLGTLLMFLITMVTVDIYPSPFFTDSSFILTWRSIIYGVIALLVAVAAVACINYFLYVEGLLSMDWENSKGEVAYLHIRHELENAKALAKQVGFNAGLKSAGIVSLIIWYQDQQVYHSIILAILAIFTTTSFFCHREARKPVLRFLRLAKPESNQIDPLADTEAYHAYLAMVVRSVASGNDNDLRMLDARFLRSSNSTPLPQEESGWKRFVQHMKRCYRYYMSNRTHPQLFQHDPCYVEDRSRSSDQNHGGVDVLCVVIEDPVPGERQPVGFWVSTASRVMS